MAFTPEEEISLLDIGPKESADGSVYFPEEYVKLLRKYAHYAREKYNTGNNNSRDGIGEALFLAAKIVKTLAPELEIPIIKIFMALGDLNNGQQLEILKPNRTGNRPITPIIASLAKAQIAVAIELHYREHGDLISSAKWAFNYAKNWEIPKTKKNFTFETLLSWRKECKEGSKEEQLPIAYKMFLDDFIQTCGTDNIKLSNAAENLLSESPLLRRKIEKVEKSYS